jgi:hypothetical protein
LAALWYYEKRLYSALNPKKKAEDIGYEEAINNAADSYERRQSTVLFNQQGNKRDDTRGAGGLDRQDVSKQNLSKEKYSQGQGTRVGFAPFREGDIRTPSESGKVFSSKAYQDWKDLGASVADSLGLTSSLDTPSLGIFGKTSEFYEPSRLLELEGDRERIRTFAALMGVLAPDQQYSVMVNTYDESAKSGEVYLTFEDAQAAEDFIDNRSHYGFDDLSFIPETNTVLLLNDGTDEEAAKFAAIYEEYGQKIETELRRAEIDFIEEPHYRGIVQEARSSLSGHDEGTRRENLGRFLGQAEDKLQKQEITNTESEPLQMVAPEDDATKLTYTPPYTLTALRVLNRVKREGQCKLVIKPGASVPGFVVFADCRTDAAKATARKIRKGSLVTVRGKFQTFGASAVCLSDCRLR